MDVLSTLKSEISGFKTSYRKQAKIKLALQAASGSGKTYSALLLAYGLTNDWTTIAIIDTENHSADLYAHLGNFNFLSLENHFHRKGLLKQQSCVKRQEWK